MESLKNSSDPDLEEKKEATLINWREFWNLLKELVLFVLFCLMLALIPFSIFYFLFGLDWIFDNMYIIGGLLFYPCFLGALLLWIKIVKKRDLKELFLGRPQFPEKGHRWFYYLWILGWSIILIIYLVMLATNLAYISVPAFNFGVTVFNGVIGAAIVEELFFRGYLYSRCEDLFGKNRHYVEWTRQEYNKSGDLIEKPFMTFEITYAALLSSLIFGIAHMNPLQSIITFFGGLFFCKFRNEWKSLIPGMFFHGMWNALVIFYVATEFNFAIPFIS